MRISISLGVIVAVAVLAPAAGAPTMKIVVPPGFRVTTFAAGLEHPTAMAWGPDGRLYVTEDTGRVVVARRGRGSRSWWRAGCERRSAWPGETARCTCPSRVG